MIRALLVASLGTEKGRGGDASDNTTEPRATSPRTKARAASSCRFMNCSKSCKSSFIKSSSLQTVYGLPCLTNNCTAKELCKDARYILLSACPIRLSITSTMWP